MSTRLEGVQHLWSESLWRPVSNIGSSPANFYTTDQQDSRVCGNLNGYWLPGGKSWWISSVSFRARPYLRLHGDRRHHNIIWNYVAGAFENCSDHRISNCPLLALNHFLHHSFFNDPLWHGEQCEFKVGCCSGTKSPPWFGVQLSTHTTDRIEVRICGDKSTSNEDTGTPIQLLEIYVQWTHACLLKKTFRTSLAIVDLSVDN